MKKYLIIFALSMTSFVSFAQKQTFYCEIKGFERAPSGLKIVFDLGISPVYSDGGLLSKQKIVDENGKEIPFNSMVDAGNYLSNKGWLFKQAYSSVYGGHCIIHWIFTKEADSIEDALIGIETKDSFKKKQK